MHTINKILEQIYFKNFMNKTSRIIIAALFILSINTINAQNNKYLSELDREKIIFNQLDEKSQNLMKKLYDDEKKADKLMEIADKYYKQLSEYRTQVMEIKNQKKRNKLYKKMEKVENAALQSRIEALDNYHNAAVRKYQVYKKDLQKFYKNASASEKDSAKNLEQSAFDAFDQADVKVQIAYHTVDHSEVYNIYTQAYILEQTGLLYQHKIYSIFLKWNKETKQHIDKEIKSLKNNIPLNFNSADSIIVVKDSIIYKKVVVHDTIVVKEKSPDIVFRVQIAASKRPIPPAQLQKIYSAGGTIYTNVEDGWYKYSVGMFDNYHDAKKFKINIGVKDAFVVAYKNNHRINIVEAMKQ